MKKVLYAFILMLCLVGGLGVGLIYRKHLADQAAGGGGDPGGIVAANDPGNAANANGALGIPGAIATTTAPDAAGGDLNAALGGGQPASTPIQPATPASTQSELSTADVTGRTAGQPMAASDFTPSSSGGSSSSSMGSSSSTSTGSGHHHHGSSGGGATTTTFASSEPVATPVPRSRVADDSASQSFGNETGGEDATPKASKSGKRGKTARATPAPTAVASSGGADAEMPTIDDNSGNGGGSSAGGGSDPFGTMEASTPAPTPETKVAMIPKSGGGELDFPAGASGSYLKKVTQRQNGEKSIIHVDLAGSASYRVIGLRNPSRVFIDFEETSVPGGSSASIAGTVNHVKEISAKQFTSAGGISIARVQIVLTDDKVPGASKGTADGGLDVVLGEKQDSF